VAVAGTQQVPEQLVKEMLEGLVQAREEEAVEEKVP
jgi:hypothetical protein